MIDKLQLKLTMLKRKANPKVVGIIIFMTFAALVIFGLEMSNKFKKQKNLAQDEYNKSMYLAVSYINNIEVEMSKVMITSTPNLTATTLADIWRQSNLAKESLENIPVSQNALANVSKYLTQVSDFSYTLMKQNILGEKITDEEYENMKKISKESKVLSKSMQDIYDDLNNSRIKWDELEKLGNSKLPNIEIAETMSSIYKISKNFQNYEGLIYDGAFSDHILSSSPKSLSENEVSEDNAIKYIKNMFGEDKIKSIVKKDDSTGRLELFNFEVKLNDSDITRIISITKKGGKIYLMLGDRKVKEEKLSIDDAKQKGLDFLKSIGIDNVKDTYYQKYDNMAIINYAAVQDGVVLYPDLIKVKVALDNGEICSSELQGYIFNHEQRKDITPSISVQKAQSVINKNIEILSSDIAIIPTESKSEILVYEFKGKIENREFLIYINAHTAVEEKVLLIIDSKNGVLTM